MHVFLKKGGPEGPACRIIVRSKGLALGGQLGKPPLAVFQGVDDSTVSPAGARHLVAAAGSRCRSLYLYRGRGHNISIEPDVNDWLEARLVGAADHEEGTVLHVREPAPGVSPAPPGSSDANAGTRLETVREPAQQAEHLDAIFGERGGGPL